MKSIVRTLAVAIGLGMTAGSASAAWQLNGSASQVGSDLHLTTAGGNSAGSAFLTPGFVFSDSQSFALGFDFEIEGTGARGDGLVAMLQSVGPTSIGGNGSDLGYFNGPASSSLAFAVDTYGAFTPALHLYWDGVDLATPVVTNLGDAIRNVVWHAGLEYQAFTHDLSGFMYNDNGDVFTIHHLLDPMEFNNQTVYLGFSAANGAATDLHTIANVVVIGAVPEPAEWALMLAGLGLVGWAARRRVRQAPN